MFEPPVIKGPPPPMVSNPNEDRDGERLEQRLDEQELASFPASDPHSDWAGAPTWAIAVQRRRRPELG
jgi:hypothetical protein